MNMSQLLWKWLRKWLRNHAVLKISFKRKDKAETLGDIFYRACSWTDHWPCLVVLTVCGSIQHIRAFDARGYELRAQPVPSFPIWGQKYLSREVDKPQILIIADYSCAIFVSDEEIKDSTPKTDQYVPDGGSPLHRLQWKAGDSYGTIAQAGTDFTACHYGLDTMVYDGYSEGQSTKDNTHRLRGHDVHPVVHFTAESEFSGRKIPFCQELATRKD